MILDRVRGADPVRSQPELLLDSETLSQLVAEKLEPTVVVGDRPAPASLVERGWRVAAASFAVVAMAVGVAIFGPASMVERGEPQTVASPITTPEHAAETEALEVVDRFFDALSAGDAETAIDLMQPRVVEGSDSVRRAIEFLAALPGRKVAANCRAGANLTREGTTLVLCDMALEEPISRAIDRTTVSEAVRVEVGGRLASKPTMGPHHRASFAFVEYAIQLAPEAFAERCDPDAYQVWEANRRGGHAWTAACGELWAELAEGVAAWVEAGKPDLGSSP